MPIINVIEIFQYFATNEKWCQIWTCHMEKVWFRFIYIVWIALNCHKTEKFWFWKSLKYFNIFWYKIYDVRFEHAPWKNVWSWFIAIVWVHFSHKTEKFWCLNSWKNFKFFFIKKKKKKKISWCQILISSVKQGITESVVKLKFALIFLSYL